MPDCGGYHFQTNTYGETRGLTASLMVRIGRLKLSSLNPLTVFDGAVGTWWLFCIASSTFDVETFTVIAGMEYMVFGVPNLETTCYFWESFNATTTSTD